jgi:hypothetical protein
MQGFELHLCGILVAPHPVVTSWTNALFVGSFATASAWLLQGPTMKLVSVAYVTLFSVGCVAPPWQVPQSFLMMA